MRFDEILLADGAMSSSGMSLNHSTGPAQK